MDIHALEQKILALMTFFTTHMNELQQMKKDIEDLFQQVSAMKAAAEEKK